MTESSTCMPPANIVDGTSTCTSNGLTFNEQCVDIGDDIPISLNDDNDDNDDAVFPQANTFMVFEPPTVATYRKNDVCNNVVKDFSVKDKRKMFLDMRNSNVKIGVDTFFPHCGLTAGEFSLYSVLNESNRKKK